LGCDGDGAHAVMKKVVDHLNSKKSVKLPNAVPIQGVAIDLSSAKVGFGD
jgi:hypothetical protein